MRVLVAEDDNGLRDVLARGLREHDYVVDAVRDGEDAVRFLRSYELRAGATRLADARHVRTGRGALDAA